MKPVLAKMPESLEVFLNSPILTERRLIIERKTGSDLLLFAAACQSPMVYGIKSSI